MKYNRVGNSGLMVSELCLGAMMFGDQTDLAETRRIVDAAADAGVNFVDTSNIYAYSESENFLGEVLRGRRDDWVLATKVGASMKQGVIETSTSRKRIMMEMDRSLKRLRTDYVDLYYLHVDDLNTPLEEPVRAMGDLIAAGKARYWGFSNFFAWRIPETVRVADALGVPRPMAMQAAYNIVNRSLEQEHIPACMHLGIGVVAYSPLARGVLTGKYVPGAEPPADSRAGRKDVRILDSEIREESLVVAQKLKAHAEAQGMTAAEFAVKWVLNNKAVATVIGGPKNVQQWQGYVSALDRCFSAADEAAVDALVKPGFGSTPFFADPKLPPRGRVPVAG
jgi:aryl-alcohol dehydrogenase-like predicted oxidoreductase